MSTVVLDQYIGLFKSEAAYDEFTNAIASGLGHDMRVIMVRGRVIGAALSAEGAKEVLYQRLVKHLCENPNTVDKLTKRLSEDLIVD